MNTITNWEDIPLIFDISYATKLFNINARAAQRLASSKKITAFKISGKWMFYKIDMKNWVDRIVNQ